MEIRHSFEVNQSVDQVRSFLRNVESLAACLPGCSHLQQIDEHHYSAVMEVQVAFFNLRFNVSVEVVEDQGDHLRATVTGTPAGIAGKLTMTADLNLEPLPEARTKVSYVLQMSLTGKLGSLGQSALRSKAEAMGAQFAANVKHALEGSEVIA